MRFAVFSAEGTSLSWQRRLLDEGNEVCVYIAPKAQADVGAGIVPVTRNYEQWSEWGRGGVYLFDGNGKDENGVSFGLRADMLRKRGELVVGGGAFCDRLEGDRAFGESVARSVGMRTPKSYQFASISATIAFAKSHKETFVFKSDRYLEAAATYPAEDQDDLVRYLTFLRGRFGDRIPNILQKKLEGFALSTARWWNGRSFVGPYEGTAEHKKFMDGDRGPATGCAFNYLWFYRNDQPIIARALNFEKLESAWRKYQAPPGIYDINALLSKDDGEPYFLEWTPRMGYDSEPTAQRGIRDLGKFIHAVASGGGVDDLFERRLTYGSVRLTVPPYPFEGIEKLDRQKLIGAPVAGIDGIWSKHFIAYGIRGTAGGFSVADPGGIVGLSLASGTDVDLFEKCYAFIERLRIPSLQCRTDAQEKIAEDLRTIVRLGYEVV